MATGQATFAPRLLPRPHILEPTTEATTREETYIRVRSRTSSQSTMFPDDPHQSTDFPHLPTEPRKTSIPSSLPEVVLNWILRSLPL